MKHRILVVEDEALVASDLQAALMELGYAVPITVDSGEEAIRVADADRPDLVLMDIHLYGAMDGVTAAEHLRTRFDVPVVYLTAFADEKHLERAKHTKPLGYLLKPFNDRQLRATVEMAITRAQVDRAVRLERRWFETTLRSIGDGVIAVDANQTIRFINPVAEALTGWSSADAIGQPVQDVFLIVHEHSGEPVHSPVTQALAQGVITALGNHCALVTRSGERIPIDDSVGPIPSEQGAVDGAIIVFRDGRPSRAFHEQLAHSDRLQSLGTLAAGVAHELSNPLAYAVSNVDFAHKAVSKLMAPELEDARIALEEAMDGLSRIKGLVSDLRKFVRGDGGPIVGVDVLAAIRVALKMASGELQGRAAVTLDFATDLPLVAGSESKLAQVFLNLLVNAAQAFADPGAKSNAVRIAVSSDLTRGVRICISDTGAGMPPASIRRLFEPFFTTKAVGAGTGLGLSVSHGIVKRLGGEITVTSEVGRGTDFTVMLPRFRPADEVKGSSSKPPKRRLLVVDDEVIFGNLLARTLSDEYDVATVTSAHEALGRIKTGERFDAIACDIGMDELSGPDLWEEVALADPEQASRMLLMTGAPVHLPRVSVAVFDKTGDLNELRTRLRGIAHQADLLRAR